MPALKTQQLPVFRVGGTIPKKAPQIKEHGGMKEYCVFRPSAAMSKLADIKRWLEDGGEYVNLRQQGQAPRTSR